MYPNFEKMVAVINCAMETMETMNENDFMICMCMMFDEYHARNRKSSFPEEMAKIVAEQVKAVNDTEGRY